MKKNVQADSDSLGKEAAKLAGSLIRETIEKKGGANIILATGSSQFATIRYLIEDKDIEWNKITMFHLDEYIDLPLSHKASFRKYLQERFLDKVPALRAVHLINGNTDAATECSRLGQIIRDNPIDVALAGIGENGHLAFNDPPADFETEEAYLIADLDRACRQQQVNEGWFESVADVPKQAISMSIKQILKSKYIICSVPGKRKAKAVQSCLEEAISNMRPASILQNHADCYFFLDQESASLLNTKIHSKDKSIEQPS